MSWSSCALSPEPWAHQGQSQVGFKACGEGRPPGAHSSWLCPLTADRCWAAGLSRAASVPVLAETAADRRPLPVEQQAPNESAAKPGCQQAW